MFERMNVLPIYLVADSIVRGLGQWYGHSTRLFSQGMPLRAPVRKLQPSSASTVKRKVVRRRVKKRPSNAAPPQEDFEMSAQMLRMQRLRQQQQEQALA